jgi:hypothetical protein
MKHTVATHSGLPIVLLLPIQVYHRCRIPEGGWRGSKIGFLFIYLARWNMILLLDVNCGALLFGTPCTRSWKEYLTYMSHTPKFLSAVARPQFDTGRNQWFNGKLGLCWPITHQVPAQCDSANRQRGTLEWKDLTMDKVHCTLFLLLWFPKGWQTCLSGSAYMRFINYPMASTPSISCTIVV